MPSESFDVADALADVANRLNEEPSLQETLDGVVATVIGTVPGVEHASIFRLHRNGRLDTIAASSDLVRELDDIQRETHEGPCYEALTEEKPVVVGNVDDADRWPQFAPRARSLGVRARMAFLLIADEHVTAALNCYSTRLESFTHDDRHLGQLFATHAAVAMGRARMEHDLNQALVTRREIGQAIGIVMERYTLTEDGAFRFLVRLSRDSNTKLRDVAHEVVRSLEEQAADDGR